MRDGHTVSNTRRELPLPFQDRRQHFLPLTAIPRQQQGDQLAQDTRLVPRLKRNSDTVGSEQFGQSHSGP